ncbi:kinase-like domain-containing protein, partial [Microdochium trichocladiopsis]
MRVMDMGMGMRLPYVPHPANDLQLSLRQPPVPPQRASHYKTSFEEISFLGKGGFGSVFKCWNRFDDRMYAVKKIPLSPRLSKSFCEGGHDRLGKLLREVRALATFDHSNIVRYHATWIEEPSHSATENAGRARTTRVGYAPPLAAQMRAGNPRRQPKLLEHHPLHTASDSEPSFSDSPQQHEVSAGNDIVFGFDTNSGQPSAAGHSSLAGPPGPQWSEQPGSTNRIEELSSSEGQDDSDIFTDGDRLGASARDIVPTGITVPDPTVHVLHIQMSLYPMTLAQYLSPTRPPTHCFHLIPSLRLLLSILTGLQYIHSKGLIHRDIKPGNIFLSPASPSTTESSHSGYCNVGDCDSCHAANTSSSGTPPTTSSSPTSSSATNKSSPIWLNPRIGDFGLVTQLAREGLSSSSPDSLEQSLSGVFGSEVSSDKDEHLVGTMYYRPPRWPPSSQPSSPGRRRPEQPPQPPQPQQQPTRKSAKPRNLDEKLDIFALGVVLVEMLACCHTAMQRVDMLKAIQDGRIPAEDIRRCCAVRDHHLRHQEQQKRQLEQQVVVENGIADQVVALVEGMLALDPDERWNGSRVRAAVEKILIEYKASKDVV